jgi:pimeloyl-ACP methyl ester carboxylesterase
MVRFVTRLVFVHGSVTNAERSWPRQAPLASRYEVLAPDRPGFWPGPPVERVDFDVDAEWLLGVVAPGDHLVAHSYGAVAALVAAARLPLASLTVIEPPAFAVARGVPEVEAWLETYVTLRSADAFLAHVGAPLRLPEPLPPDLEQGVEALLRERPPTEARITPAPLPYPVLVVTGGHEPAFEAVGDVLERELRAERVVLPGAGHAAQNADGFNEALVAFVERANRSDAGS